MPPVLTLTRAGTGENRHRLTATTGVAALGLDALASVSYGPQAIVLALAAAGAAGIGWTLPVTGAIVLLLVVLVAAYRQVVHAYPDGGGAYTVARRNLGERAGLVAAAALIVDYVLNAAVATAAGVAALTSAVPALLPWTTELCLAVLTLVTVVNLRGVAASARAFAVPTALFVLAVLAVIAIGLLRGAPLNPLPDPAPAQTTTAVGVLLVLSAFANGCASLTGIEAIANATPSFRSPRPARAARAQALLGLLLGVMLLGLAALVELFDLRPVEGRTVLSLLVQGAVGDGAVYLVVQFTTVVLLALSANTSFGGLPVLAARLAADHYLPHAFGLRADRLVHRIGVLVLAGLAAALIVGSGGRLDVLVPMFTIGVFVGFALCQAGMVRHWLARGERGRRLALNLVGAVLSAVAAVVVTVVKFAEGAWLVVLVLPLLVFALRRVHRAYAVLGRQLGVGSLPELPKPHSTLVVVPVAGLSVLTSHCLSTALSLGHKVVAVHVGGGGQPPEQQRALAADWTAWHPDVPLMLLERSRGGLGASIAAYVRGMPEQQVVVLIGELRPRRAWIRLLLNGQGGGIARAVRARSQAAVCRLHYRLP